MENQPNNELIKIAEKEGLEKPLAEIILSKFQTFFEEAKGWEVKARAIKITDPSQTAEMALAREARLELKNLRVAAKKTHKAEKEVYLRGGRTVDGIYNIIESVIVPLEEYLEGQEKFVERIEAEKKEKINQERIAALAPFVSDTSFFNLKEMSQQGFDQLLKDSEVAYNARVIAEKKAEEDRIAKEKADAAEQAKIKEENEKLKKEKVETDRVVAEQKKKDDAEKKKLADEKAAVEKELQDKKDADAKAAREKKEEEDRVALEKRAAEDKLAQQSDKEKLVAFAETLEKIVYPEVKSREAENLVYLAKRDIGIIIADLKK